MNIKLKLQLMYTFRQEMCRVWCNKDYDPDKCPNSCPVKRLNLNSFETIRIRDLLKWRKI